MSHRSIVRASARLVVAPLLLVIVLGLATEARAQVLADSIADWAGSNAQGADGWRYGYWNYTTDNNQDYDDSEFTQFSAGQWRNTFWRLAPDNAPWTLIAEEAGHPNGTNSAPNEEMWAIRRWTSDHTGQVAILFRLRAQNTNGAGTACHLFLNGTELDAASVSGSDSAGYERVVVTNISNGDHIDLALTPVGPGGNRHDGSDGSFFSMTITTEIPEIPDEDDDGIPDETDNCISTANASQANSDGDSFGNACDNCPNTTNESQVDTDGDGEGDHCEDSDSDGHTDFDDNCPQDANGNQADSDSDGIGNVCDNCPSHSNPFQQDGDEDGIGDRCDPDTPGGIPGPWPVSISEVHYNPMEGEQLEFVELHNYGTATVNLTQWSFPDGLDFTFPAGTEIAADEYLVLCRHPAEVALFYGLNVNDLVPWGGSFLSNGGENLRLQDALGYEIDRIRYDDAVPYPPEADGTGPSLQRLCDGTFGDRPVNWVAAPPTPGAAPATTQCPPAELPPPAIAINEVHYHPPNDSDDENEYIELINTTDATIDLIGYEFTAGLTFVFENSTLLDPGEMLLVCRNETELRANLGVTSRTIGDFTGQLSNSGERLTLVDADGNLADSVNYRDSGLWPIGADGLGHSLEKILATAPSDDPASWLDSGAQDPSGGGDPEDPEWTTVSAEGVGTGSSHRFYFYIEGSGEFLIDDIRLIDVSRPNVDLAPNVGFDNDINGYEPVGNHSTSRWSQAPGGTQYSEPALHLISTGTGSGSSNSVRCPTLEDIDRTGATIYRLTFRYQHLSGSESLVARITSASASRGVYWRFSGGGGGAVSPGERNIVARNAVAPMVSHLTRWPKQPTSSDPVTITCRARGNPDSVVLDANISGGAQAFTMRDDGVSGDGAAGDGIYGTELPAQPDQRVVTFTITASSAADGSRISPLRTDTEEFNGYYVNDNQPDSNLPVFHFLVPSGNPRSWITSRSCSSYSSINFAFEGDLYYDVDLRRRGGSVCGAEKPYLKIRFHKGHEFKFSEHPPHKNLNFQSLWTDKGLIRENLAWQTFNQMGRATCSHEYIRIQANGDYYALYAALERPDERFLERNGLNSDGDLFKATASREQVGGTYEKKTNEHTGHGNLIQFLDELNNTPNNELVDFFETRTAPEAIIDYQASQILINNRDYPHKNHYLYHNLESDKWRPTGWDLDLSYGKRWDGSNKGVLNDLMDTPGTDPWYTTTARGGGDGNRLHDRFFSKAGTHFQRAYVIRLWDAIQEKYKLSYYAGRIDFFRPYLMIEQQNDINEWGRSSPSNNDPTAPPGFEDNLDRIWNHIVARREYLVNYLLNNEDAGDHDRLKITEIMYNPFGSDDLEYLEIWNSTGRPVNLSGWTIQGIGDATGDWGFPSNTIVDEDEVFIVAKDPAAFTAVHGASGRVFGPYPGRLDNDGEVIRIKDDGPGYPATVEFVRYERKGNWPEGANGFGPSLELMNVDALRDNDRGEHWQASANDGGSPGFVEGIISPNLTLFTRGDSNGDGFVDLGDAVHSLVYMFAGGNPPNCQQATDADGNDAIELNDPVTLLNHLYRGGPAPPAPFPSCGPASDAGLLSCENSLPCT